ncbi:Fe2+ or Zn2+ uptake regulation protein [Aminobacter niigataensis]|uniref:Ferric uptake regulation protein n=1 Tax=Aminobacter niigataensis TaxID=83265 RepID=A0ABR6L9P1_9HYPH|nr:Fur family transcriptional regulator [Aminobacter niigataensis]MBB4653346.1 Fe2+ or Zn2+ uptake regulation protein [Aminobacter niigataensis]
MQQKAPLVLRPYQFRKQGFKALNRRRGHQFAAFCLRAETERLLHSGKCGPIALMEPNQPSLEQTEIVETIYRSKGLRITEPRRTIISVISEMTDYPDMVELHRRIQAVNRRTSLSTVYRNLRQLVEAGVVIRHTFEHGRSRYELAGRPHHDHLIDHKTGKLIEFHSPELEKMLDDLAARYGYRVVGHRLEVYVEALRRPIRRID